MTAIESPCNKVCTVDPRSALCVGCGRTLAEIANWVAFTAERRREVMAALPGRLRALRAQQSVRPLTDDAPSPRT